MAEVPKYFMDDTREKERLADKVDPSSWVAEYVNPLMNGVHAILDVGCGPGVLATEIARCFPAVNVTAADMSADRLQQATRNSQGLANLRIAECDAHNLPFEDESFDLVYSRFLVEYLTDKPRAVREMVRVLRPGGRLLLQDLDGQLLWHFPEDESLQPAIQAVVRVLAQTGFDPFVGRKLFSFCVDARLQEIDVSVSPYHLFAGRIDSENDRLWELKLDIALPAAEKALGNRAAAEQIKQQFLNYLRNPRTLTYSVLFSVVGRRPMDEGQLDQLR